MNNLTFGDADMGYYETVAGGAGAGPGWHGRSGVHTHMTNTRITDPEILERRYPVVLHRFSLRPGSGGPGHWRGGDGVVREVRHSPFLSWCLHAKWLCLAYDVFAGFYAQKNGCIANNAFLLPAVTWTASRSQTLEQKA